MTKLTNYDDLSGNISVDLQDISSLAKLCKYKNITIDDKHLIWLRVRKTKKNIYVCILYINKKVWEDFYTIQSDINKHSTIKVNWINIEIEETELYKYFKRTEYIITTKLIDSWKEIEIIDKE